MSEGLGYLSRGQSGIVQDGGDHVHPEQDVVRNLGEVLEDDDLHSSAEQEEGGYECIDLDRPDENLFYAAALGGTHYLALACGGGLDIEHGKYRA